MDVQLAEEVMSYIKAHPKEFDQTLWCGTAHCFAGHTVAVSGYTLDNQAWSVTCTKDGREFVIPMEAARLLGITSDQAEVLFAASNTVEDLEILVKELANDPDISDECLVDCLMFETEDD